MTTEQSHRDIHAPASFNNNHQAANGNVNSQQRRASHPRQFMMDEELLEEDQPNNRNLFEVSANDVEAVTLAQEEQKRADRRASSPTSHSQGSDDQHYLPRQRRLGSL